MMRVFRALSFAAALRPIASELNPSAPGCAVRCWENTQYVSKCLGDTACLCAEANYQNSVYQCLYSQCDFTHFGLALHHTMSQCPGFRNEILLSAPPIPNRDSLRRREAEHVAGDKIYGSGSAGGYSRDSMSLPTQSADFMTRSITYPTQSAGGPYSPSATSALPAYAAIEAPSSPAVTSATPTEPIFDVVPASPLAEPQPQLFTGAALQFCSISILPVMVATLIHYWFL